MVSFFSWCSFGAFQGSPPPSLLAPGLKGWELIWLRMFGPLADGQHKASCLRGDGSFAFWFAFFRMHHVTLSIANCDKGVLDNLLLYLDYITESWCCPRGPVKLHPTSVLVEMVGAAWEAQGSAWRRKGKGSFRTTMCYDCVSGWSRD